MNWKILLFIVIVFFVTFFFTRIVSISSIMGALGLIFSTLAFYVINASGLVQNVFENFTIYRLTLAIVASVVSIWLHRTNILRLLNGEEKTFSFKKKEKLQGVAVTKDK